MKKIKLGILILVSIVLSGINTIAYSENSEEKEKLSRKERKEIAMQEGKFWISPLGLPLYTPELGLYLTVGAQMSFKTNPDDTLLRRSSVPFFVGYGLRGSLDIFSKMNTYWLGDRLRINNEFRIKNMRDHYWGVGFDKGLNTEKSDSTTEYQRLWILFNPQIKYRVADNFYAGIDLNYSYTEASDENPVMQSDADYRASKDMLSNTGVGVIAEYDSRDIPVNAYEGIYLSGKATFFSSSLGGDSDFNLFSIDYRQYTKIYKESGVLAWIVRGETVTGDVPWSELPKLGTPFDMRGYYWGRYRDNTIICAVAEYRHTIFWRGKRSPVGFVVWVGGGSMGPEISELSQILPNGGVGLRYEVQPRMNLRVDFGFGRETTGLYFNLLEAF